MTKDSRLERFLKALCSLDYSDLPTPLSRVEVLWNCLITGEAAPDFQPQSRTEKYLMTILGVYDLEDIPKPISRVETLLYKLATGDTDVEMEGGAKSRYERLLSEIVANGGVGDNVDFEYVTYVLSESFNTLYNTVEKPVKSAILKGSTKYRDIDTGDILDTFDETKNLELVSVKMPVLTTTGKNLMPVNHASLDGIKSNAGGHINNLIAKNIPVIPGKTYRLSYSVSNSTNIQSINMTRFEHQEKTNSNNHQQLFNEIGKDDKNLVFTIPQGINYISFTFGNAIYTNDGTLGWIKIDNIQLEEGSIDTTYEPYKSNILTVNEPVELRGIGDVKDELNLLTGELTQRIGEIVLDGSENWIASTNQERIAYILPHKGVAKVFRSPISDKWICGGNSSATFDTFFYVGGSYFNYITNQEISLADFKAQLSDNPVSVQYFLATESVKTVDLSTLDQDGNKTKLKTFNDITHVSLSSEGLIPEAELTVATKNLDDISQASTMSLRMNDISDKQNELQNEADMQSENIDSTMMATTEIYEQTL